MNSKIPLIRSIDDAGNASDEPGLGHRTHADILLELAHLTQSYNAQNNPGHIGQMLTFALIQAVTAVIAETEDIT